MTGKFIHGDCMDYLTEFDDNHFDLAIVDPPYGIGDKFKGGKTGKMNFNEVVNKGWDQKPPPEYWKQLFRVCKNQIIWGGNYFVLPATRCFIVWDKQISKDFSLAMAELAWTSFDMLAKIYRLPTPKDGKIHPTQKPVQLYRWLLQNYAKQGDLILDTHVGSGSSLVACEMEGFDYISYEIDQEYYDGATKRIKAEQSKISLF